MNASTLLSTWEEGTAQPPLRRTAALLAAAWPERSREAWVSAPIGERDERLLGLHEVLFGGRFDATAECPTCGERLEVRFAARDVRVPPPDVRYEDGCLRVDALGYGVRYRLPNSEDLLALVETPSEDPRRTLLRRCVVEATRRGKSVDVDDLPARVLDAVEEGMARADPQADVSLALACPQCAHAWSTAFDVAAHLWGELDDWAERLLVEIHRLASAYGWSERDILEMSSRRRRVYLELVGA